MGLTGNPAFKKDSESRQKLFQMFVTGKIEINVSYKDLLPEFPEESERCTDAQFRNGFVSVRKEAEDYLSKQRMCKYSTSG